MSAAFFDTNIVIYSIDPDPESQDKSEFSKGLLRERTKVFSTQVLMETVNTIRKKKIASIEKAHAFARILSHNAVVGIEVDDVLNALDTASRYQLSHWNGLILRAAEKARVDVVYTEDMKHGETYGSVRVCNPFIEDFLTT